METQPSLEPDQKVPLSGHLCQTAILFKNSLSAIMSYVLEMFIMTVNIHIAGSWPDQSFVAGLGLAVVLIHSLGGSMAQGFNNGYVTFAGRAYGNRNFDLLTDYNRKQTLALLICALALAILLLLAQDILLLLGQDAQVAHVSYLYGLYLLPSFLLYYVFDFLRCFLNSMDIYTPVTVVLLLSGIFHFALSTYFQDWEFWAPIGCTFLSYLLGAFLLLLYAVVVVKESRTLSLPRPSTLRGFWPYFKDNLILAMPQFLDVFSFQINSLIVGSFKIVEMTAAHVSVSNLIGTLYSLSFGIGSTVCAMGSNYVGENQPRKLRHLYSYSLFISLTIAAAIFGLMYVDSTFLIIAGFYTNSDVTIAYMRKAIDIYKWFFFFDYTQGSTSSFLKVFGFGQSLMWSYILVYYVVGVSLSFILAIWLDMEIQGVWFSFATAITCICLYIQFKLLRTDWAEQTKRRFLEVEQEKVGQKSAGVESALLERQ